MKDCFTKLFGQWRDDKWEKMKINFFNCNTNFVDFQTLHCWNGNENSIKILFLFSGNHKLNTFVFFAWILVLELANAIRDFEHVRKVKKLTIWIKRNWFGKNNDRSWSRSRKWVCGCLMDGKAITALACWSYVLGFGSKPFHAF